MILSKDQETFLHEQLDGIFKKRPEDEYFGTFNNKVYNVWSMLPRKKRMASAIEAVFRPDMTYKFYLR